MKKLQKPTAVLVSLALCLSLTAPALAASFEDLQAAIDGRQDNTADASGDSAPVTEAQAEEPQTVEPQTEEPQTEEPQTEEAKTEDPQTLRPPDELPPEPVENPHVNGALVRTETGEDGTARNYYGYGWSSREETTKDDAGNDRTETRWYYAIEAHDAETGERVVVLLEDVNFDKSKDNTAHKDSSGTYHAGVVVDGSKNKSPVSIDLNGHEINLNPDAELDAESGRFTDADGNEEKDLNKGAVINVKNDARLTVKNGTITGGNTSTGGGIYVQSAGKSTSELPDLTLDGVVIEKNLAFDGGGIYASDAVIKIKGGEIRENVASNNGGGIQISATRNNWHDGSSLTLEGTRIESNKGVYGGGLAVGANPGKCTVTAGKDVVIANNHVDGDWSVGDDIFAIQGATLVGFGVPANETLTDDGKPITGWYWDMPAVAEDPTSGWGNNGDYSYYLYDSIDGTWGANIGLKAAHNQYFGASYYLDEAAEEAYAVTDAENGFEKGFAPSTGGAQAAAPTREGWVFGGWEVTEGVDENGIVTGALKFVAKWTEAPEEPAPIPPAVPDGAAADDDGGAAIDEAAVPLAGGPVTRAEFVNHLWEHEGQPAGAPCTFPDVPADHAFVLALGWAQEQGIAVGYDDGAFRPDELVTVADARTFLTRFADVKNLTMPALTTLAGGDDELVLNAGEVLAEFFGGKLVSAGPKAA